MPVLSTLQTQYSAVGLCLDTRDRGGKIDGGATWQCSLADACRFVAEAAAFVSSDYCAEAAVLPRPAGLRISGLEPFDRLPDLRAVVALAASNGFIVDVHTTGMWATTPTIATDILTSFEGRITILSIYTSEELLQNGGTEYIANVIRAAKAVGVAISLDCIVGNGLPIPAALLEMDILNSESSMVRFLPHSQLLDGRSPPGPSAELLLSKPPRYRRCAEYMAIMISPRGDVYPCSRGMGVESLALGTLSSEPLEAIVRRASDSRALRSFRDSGPYWLYDRIEASPESSRLYRGYVDSCHFHRHVMMDPMLAAYVNPPPSTGPRRLPVVE